MTDIEPLILVIEDNLQTQRFLRASLAEQAWRVIQANTGKQGLAMMKSQHPDLIVLDLGLPDMDGVAVIRALRQFSEIPVIILSARSQERDKIQALNAGADDYLTKPFSVAELDARIRALLRRAIRSTEVGEVFQVGELKVDLKARKVYRAEDKIHLTVNEYRLLTVLIRHAGRVATHRQLLSEVWGPTHVEDIHYLRIYMGQLRHKLEADPARPRYLLTEVGVGYRISDKEWLGQPEKE